MLVGAFGLRLGLAAFDVGCGTYWKTFGIVVDPVTRPGRCCAAPILGRLSYARLGGESSALHGLSERPVIAFVLVRVGDAEVCDGSVEDVRRS